MASITTRAGKGSPLTNAEVDANFTNLNTELGQKLVGNQNITFSGDATGSGATSVALTLASSGVVAGTYGSATNIPQFAVDAKGRITSVSNVAVSIPSGSLTFTGDVTGTGSTGSSTALTLANSGITAGTYTKVTFDAKGRATSGTTLSSADLPTYTGTLTSSQVTTALGFTPYNSTNPNGYITGITSSMVTTALGYTPYNSTNPSGYITSSALSSYLPLSGGTLTGASTVAVSTWEKWTLETTGVTARARQGSDANGLNFTSNARWTGSAWAEDDSTRKKFAYIQHLGNGRHEFRTAPTGAGVSWTTSLTVDESAVNSTVALQQGGNQVVHAGNVSTYALPIGGGTTTGTTTLSSNFRFHLGSDGNTALATFRLNTSSRNLVISAPDTGALFLNWDNGSGGVNFGNGAQGVVGSVSAAGNASFNGTLNAIGAITQNGSQVLHAGNFSSYALPLSGGTLTGALNVSRRRLSFSSSYNDPNHSIYNNYENIDGEGVWDGMKMNVYAGLRIRTGNASGATPTTVFAAFDGQGVQIPGSFTMGARVNGSSYGGNTSGMSGHAFPAEIRASGARPTLTWHYENVATRHIALDADGALNVYNPGESGGAVFKVGGNVALHAGNFGSYALPLSGGTVSGYTTFDGGLSAGSGGGQRLYVYRSGTVRQGFGVDLTGNSYESDWFGSAGPGNQGRLSLGFVSHSDGTSFNEIFRVNAGGGVTVVSGTVNSAAGYISFGNPWGTANSAFFPNGITTAGSTNWVYGTTYIGNAPGNGSGLEVSSNGRLFSSVSSGTALHVRRTGSASTATNAYTALFEQTFGDHSWGIVGEFRAGGSGGSDRPSILFSNGYNSTTWSVGFGWYDDQFRIRQNHGYRNSDWGTERFRIDTGGTPYFNGNVALHAGNYSSYALPLSGGTVSGTVNFNSAVNVNGRDIRPFENDSFKEFYVGGDANTYYPVRFDVYAWFHFARWSISRGYGDTAPWDPIGTGAHRGGLTLTWEWSGDGAWGGNDKTIRVIQFAEQYTTMVGGMALSVNGFIVWLRGGNAYYRFHGPGGTMNGATPYYSTFTASNGSTFSPRSYDANTVAAEVTNRMPVRGVHELYDTGNRVLHAGNFGNYAVPLSGGTMSGRLTISPGWTTSGRNYSNEWIEFGNHSGLYSPINGAHFYPSNGSYGAWRIAGNRNSWGGLEFDGSNGNTTLMIATDSNTVGLHNNSYGWRFRVIGDNGYLYSGTYGGGSERTILHSGNFSSYALPLSGGSISGSLTVSANNATGGGIILADDGDIVDLNDGYCSMRFSLGVRVFSANRGGSAVHTLHSNGTFTASGNVTAYSDESLKKDWKPVATDFVARLADIKHGTYTRIDSGERQAGASAQDWQKLLPEVVSAGADGILSLAYGNAAVVSAIELAKDNLALRTRIERLEALVEKLIGD